MEHGGGIGYERDHTRADSGKREEVVSPAIGESRKANKKGEKQGMPVSAGGRDDPRAGTGQTGVGRGESRT